MPGCSASAVLVLPLPLGVVLGGAGGCPMLERTLSEPQRSTTSAHVRQRQPLGSLASLGLEALGGAALHVHRTYSALAPHVHW